MMQPTTGIPLRPTQLPTAQTPGALTLDRLAPDQLSTDQLSPNQPSFQEFLLEALDHVNDMQLQADRAVEQLMTGGDANPAEVLTAVQKADLSFRMMLQIRNKLVQAYQEVKDIRI
jgi:flagellar hook-basal body complex protein FliE